MRFEKVDELAFDDHYHLDSAVDKCHYLLKYSTNADIYSDDSRSLIVNLKKSPDRKFLPEWRYKEKAIEHFATILRGCFTEQDLATYTFVPVPPSKAATDPLYDDRMIQILKKAFPNDEADIRALLYQDTSMEAFHHSDNRSSQMLKLQTHLKVEESLLPNVREKIFLFDDVLVTGAHFKVCKSKIQQYLPGKTIIGLFLARRIFP